MDAVEEPEAMTDIVARLRSAAKDKDNMPRMKSETMLTVGLGLEAADEIERLRAEGAKHVDEINHLWDVIDKLRDGRVV